jgi:hypothetical protein
MPRSSTKIEPPYPFGGVNESVELHGLAAVCQDSQRTAGDTRISLEWLPTPRFRFGLETDEHVDLSKESRLEVPALQLSAPVLLTRSNAEGLSGPIGGRAAFGDGKALSSLLFMLPNTPPMAGGDSITDGTARGLEEFLSELVTAAHGISVDHSWD